MGKLLAMQFAKHLTGESLADLKSKFEDWDKAQQKAKKERLEQSAVKLTNNLPERRKQEENEFSKELSIEGDVM